MIISRDRLQCDQYYMYACIIFQNAGTYEYSNFFYEGTASACVCVRRFAAFLHEGGVQGGRSAFAEARFGTAIGTVRAVVGRVSGHLGHCHYF